MTVLYECERCGKQSEFESDQKHFSFVTGHWFWGNTYRNWSLCHKCAKELEKMIDKFLQED
jgi:hypothetical protein